MKKIFLFLVLSILISITKVEAITCQEVKTNVDNVIYDVARVFDYESVKVLINLYFLDENYKVEVSNDYNDEVKTYTSEDFVDGTLTFEGVTVLEKVNYRVRIYASDINCTSEILKTFTFETPRFNSYIKSNVCDGMYNLIELCDPFYDTGNMTLKEFNEKVTNQLNIINQPFKTKLLNFIKAYYLYVLIPFIVISIVFITKIIIFKRGKKKYV